MKAIRKRFATKFVTKYHVADYLSVDFLAVEASYNQKVKKDAVKSAIILKLRERFIKAGNTLPEADQVITELISELNKIPLPGGLIDLKQLKPSKKT